MLSERCCAQLGLGSACLVLVTTLTILYQGSRNEPIVRTMSGRQVVSGDIKQSTPASAAAVKVASLGK